MFDNMASRQERYFIQQYMQENYQHGGAGFVDAEKILMSLGFQPVLFPCHHIFSIRAKLTRLLFLFKMFFAIKKNSVVFFLFPVYARMNLLLLKWLSTKNVKIVCYIADIDGIKDGDEELLRKEISFFKRFKYFIVHNERMKDWLCKNIPGDRHAVMISFFDFLAKPFQGQRRLSSNVVFAGNLGKSPFLEKLYLLNKTEPSLHFDLYGPGQSNAMVSQANVTWHGVEEPYTLPLNLQGSFGLIWEGDSIEKPSGSLGHYIEYISHHKLSLYILARLPIIVTSSAASASLIGKYKIGFTIDNLYEIEEKIKAVSEAGYREMQVNMEPLSNSISKGDFLKNAINELMEFV
jgi:hypothetical protein